MLIEAIFFSFATFSNIEQQMKNVNILLSTRIFQQES